MTPPGIDPETVQLAAQCSYYVLNQFTTKISHFNEFTRDSRAGNIWQILAPGVIHSVRCLGFTDQDILIQASCSNCHPMKANGLMCAQFHSTVAIIAEKNEDTSLLRIEHRSPPNLAV